MPHPVVHFEIGMKNSDVSTAFYRDLFGWDVTSAGPGYWVVAPQGEGIGGGLMQATGDMPTYVTVYVSVEDLTASLGRAVELGGKLLVGPTPIPGVGSFGLFQDPDGNVIGLLQGE